MNILFVANRFPYPPYRGDKLKIYNLAKRLSAKHSLFLITFVQDKSDYEYINELKKIFGKIELVYLPKYLSVLKCVLKVFSKKPFQIIYFESSKFRKKLKGFLNENNIDAIHTQHLRMSQYTYNLKNYKRILDLPDAYSLYWKRRTEMKGNFFENLFNKIEYKKVIKFEEIIREFDLNLVCSEEDKNFLIEKHNINYIDILPNGVDLHYFKNNNHNYDINNRIIFTGNMDYFPNIDAAKYFVNEILPKVKSRFPDVEFYITGQKPVKQVESLRNKNVIIMGFVENITEEYSKSAIAISPIRYGAGTLNKVLEPMAMGIPVVSTEVGFRGLGIKSGEGVLLAKNKEQFSEHIINLLSSRALRKETGEKGKKIVYNNFDWDKIADKLEKFFINLQK
ncbi:MAG: glycosyltransferase [Chlorobi bacterium]|nr:glycosyltransferase [Chlorobiota bacterium]MCI0716198.1 glycosyltransferase [Chlorobiota bacterium]